MQHGTSAARMILTLAYCCRSITKGKLFDPVFAVFLANGPRYNMLNSSKLFLTLAAFPHALSFAAKCLSAIGV